MVNRRCQQRSRLHKPLLGCGTALLMLMIGSAIAHPLPLGQLPSLLPPNGGQSPLPAGVERRGTLESAAVRLDGRTLFRIASPLVLNRSEPGGQMPVEVRAKQIEANLERLTPGRWSDEITLDPATLKVVIDPIDGQPVLFVKDATLAEARVLLTVTDSDAQYTALSKERLAEQWQKILERDLRQALEMRQPEALQAQISTVLQAFVAMVLLTLVLSAARVVVKRQKQHLERLLAAEVALLQKREPAVTEPSTAEAGMPLLQGLRHHFGLQQRLQLLRLLQWLLFWAIALVWVVGTAYSLSIFPQTRQFARKVIAIPMVLLLAWFFTGLANRLTDLTLDRYIQIQEQGDSLTEANLQRMATIARVIKGLKMVVIYTVALLWVLQWLNLVPGSILTLGALLALVVSFAAQNLVKDLVNGFLILLEDQFRIGDNVRIGTLSGMVENLNLRITQIRSDEGHLITLPNSLITEVENRSRNWARADIRVEVSYHTDVDRALAVVRETVDQMAQDPEWSSLILDTQEVFGVDQISHTGIIIRLWIKTAPLKQWLIGREFRRRLKLAFDRHQIQIGIPQQLFLNSDYVRADQPLN